MSDAVSASLLADERVLWQGATDPSRAAVSSGFQRRLKGLGVIAVLIALLGLLAYAALRLPLMFQIAAGIFIGIFAIALTVGLAFVFFGRPTAPRGDRYRLTERRLIVEDTESGDRTILVSGARIYKIETRARGTVGDIGIYYSDPDEVSDCIFIRAIPDVHDLEAKLLDVFKIERPTQ